MAIDKEHSSIILQRLYDSQDESREKIILISGNDNQRIPIHRDVLTASSKYFKAMLGPKFQEGNELGVREFILDKSDGETVKAIADFCYTGRIDLTKENVAGILAIAASIELDLLEEKCCRFYAGRLTVNNAINTWMIADKYSNGDLRQRALDVICKSFGAVPTADFQKADHRMMRELLNCVKIRATEELVFKRLMEWFQHNEGERSKYMEGMLKSLRLKHIPSQVLYAETFVAIYNRFGCIDFLFEEYTRRALTKFSDIDDSRSGPIYCLFQHNKLGASTVIKIGKFDRASSSFEGTEKIILERDIRSDVILHGNKIFVLDDCSQFGSDIVDYVTAIDMVSREEEVLPKMNVFRTQFASISFGKYIYVFGGLHSGVTASCERFDTENKTWAPLKSMNVARSDAVATAMNGYIYVAGGRDNQHNHSKSVEMYDPKGDEWVQLPPMNHRRFVGQFSLVNSKGFLYAVGGGYVMERFDPLKSEWKEIKSSTDESSIRHAYGVGSKVFVLKHTGEFGEINFDENYGCSFVPLQNIYREGEANSKFKKSRDATSNNGDHGCRIA